MSFWSLSKAVSIIITLAASGNQRRQKWIETKLHHVVLFFIKHIPLSQFLHNLKVADRSSRLQNSALKPTLDQSFPPFVREQTKLISDRLMLQVVTGNSTSRDLTNYDFGFGPRV